MKVLYLLQGSRNVDARAVAVRRTSALFPRLAALPDATVIFATLIAEGGFHKELRKMGLSSVTVAADPWLYLPGGTIRLAKLLRRERFDVVLASQTIPALLAGVARKLARQTAPLLYFRFHEFGSRKLQLASRLAAMLSDVTIVQSKAVARRALEFDRSSPDRIRVVRDGAADLRFVHPDEVKELRTSLGIAPDAPVVTVVSRLRPEKGLSVLIEAMRELDDLRPHLVLVGSGPLMGELSRQAESALGERAHLVGHSDDIASWFALGDVSVMPSLREAFGFAAVEAMAASRPVIASRVGGLAEIVSDEVSGVLVPPNDPSALALALKRLLMDHQLREEMGRAARARYEECFTLDHVVISLHEAWVSSRKGPKA